jgi:tight adherence protein C
MFILIFGGAVLAMLLFTRDPVQARLSALDERDASRTPRAEPLAKLSVPTEGWESSPVRLRLINAG